LVLAPVTTVTKAAATTAAAVSSVHEVLHQKLKAQLETYRASLKTAPLVAVLVRGDHPAFAETPAVAVGGGQAAAEAGDATANAENPVAARGEERADDARAVPMLRDSIELVVEATLSYFGEPARLWVCAPRGWNPDGGVVYHRRLLKLHHAIEMATVGGLAHGGTCIWPVQTFGVSTAVMGLEELELTLTGVPQWKRALLFLRVLLPSRESEFVGAIHDQYGADCAFNFEWSCFYVRALWVLAVLCVIILAAQIRASGIDEDPYRTSWEISKCLVALWVFGLLAAACCRFPLHAKEKLNPNAVVPLEEGDEDEGVRFPRASTLNLQSANPDYNASETTSQYAVRLLVLALLFMSLAVYFMFIKTVFNLYVMFIMYIIYSWGDCDSMSPPCTDPGVKHGFLGTIVEILCDITLAIIFELFGAVSGALGQALAKALNQKKMEDRMFTAASVGLLLAALERVSYLMILAIIFVPQYEEPIDDEIDASATDCFKGGLWIFDQTVFACIRGKLPYTQRMYLLEKLVKGPFIVAPFVSILVKVIIPIVAERVDFWSRRCACCCSCCEVVMDGIARILSLIFVYDGSFVGGPKMIFKGWPFSDLAVVDSRLTVDEPEVDLDIRDPLLDQRSCRCCSKVTVRGSDACTLRNRLYLLLQQGARKPYEPAGELLNIKTNILFVAFFVAVMPLGPVGAIVTLVAKHIEVKFGLAKMVFVRRRCFPGSDTLLRKTQLLFLICLAMAIPAWQVTLSMITYNDHLWTWEYRSQRWCLKGLVVWMILSGVSLIIFSDRECSIWKPALFFMATLGSLYFVNPAGDAGIQH